MEINAASHLAAVNRTVLFVNSDELLRALLALTEERDVRSVTMAIFPDKASRCDVGGKLSPGLRLRGREGPDRFAARRNKFGFRECFDVQRLPNRNA